jgi:hypothetical protein
MGDCQFDIHSRVRGLRCSLEVRNLGGEFLSRSPGLHFACQILIISVTHYLRTSYESEQRSGRPDEILIVRTLIPNSFESDLDRADKNGRAEAMEVTAG